MNGNTISGNGFEIYVCPRCHRVLRPQAMTLRCSGCSAAYPIQDGIPDFLMEELATSADPELRRMRFINRMARIYETRLWYPLVLRLYGGAQSPSLPELIEIVARRLERVSGRVLDVACGPGTYGRRVACASREVFGIDVSMGMLRQGVSYLANEGIANMRFARTRVETLPFPDEFFDAALCCGSLHLFTDTVLALREIARVLKPGGLLSVFTFGAGTGGMLKYPSFREGRARKMGLHAFELSEVDGYLASAGFKDFEPELRGSILTFGARRRDLLQDVPAGKT